MKDVVYVIGEGSKWEDNELRYSLRSIHKNLSDIGEVYIIGDKLPKFIDHTKVSFICLDDNSRYPSYNILRKLIAACQNPFLSREFIYMADDYLILSPISVNDITYYYDGTLKNNEEKPQEYKEVMINSAFALSMMKRGILNYDIHTPFLYDKYLFLGVTRMLDCQLPYGYTLKSIYGNLLDIGGEAIKDCKIHGRTSYQQLLQIFNNSWCTSLSDRAITEELIDIIEETFPKKSSWEI